MARAKRCVVVEPFQFVAGHVGAEGAFQDFGQRQVVFGAEREADEVQQVLHGEAVEQLDAVGAGDGDVLALQRLQDAVEQAAGAAAHEDEEVAGLGGALLAIVPDGGAGLDLAPDELRDAARRGAALALPSFSIACGASHGWAGSASALGSSGQSSTEPGMAAPERGVAHQVGGVGRVQREGRVRREDAGVEDFVDIGEHFRRRAERHGEVGQLEVELGAFGAQDELLLLGEEVFRVGALEGVDRLLLVADDEQRAADGRARRRRRRRCRR